MSLPIFLKQISIGAYCIHLYVPDAAVVRQLYNNQSQKETPFPYWARLWPSAYALAAFIVEHKQLFYKKKVLELAAGLGLPSLMASRFAQEVYCTDYSLEAVVVLQKTIGHNALENMHCGLLDWRTLPHGLTADIVLLSDVNYDTATFELLYKLIHHFLQQGTIIVLSTPHRLMAKAFIEKLLPWCCLQQEKEIKADAQSTLISVMVLQLDTKGIT